MKKCKGTEVSSENPKILAKKKIYMKTVRERASETEKVKLSVNADNPAC